MSVRVCLALGSNLGDRAAHLQQALDALGTLPHTRLLAASDWLESEAMLPPQNPVPQPRYLNAACVLDTSLQALALLDATQALERAAGRRPGPRWSPRPLDLDLLLYGDTVLTSARLVLPHPGLATRRFVLEPLASLVPDLRHPVLGLSMAELLARLG